MSVQLIERFFEAVEAGDLNTLRSIYSPDALIWHNDDNQEQSVSDNLKRLAGLHQVVADLQYEIVRRIAIPGGFFQQHILRGRLPDGQKVAMSAAMYIAVSNGYITRIEEYLDSAQAQPIRAARAALTNT
jgi:uncharacterized protein